MQKELNPELFGERRSLRASPGEKAPEAQMESQGFLNLDRQVMELRNQAIQAQEFMKTSGLKAERLQQQVQRLEQSHNGLVQETSKKIAHIAQRLSERKAIDQKIQEMVDRHTNVIKSFEVRMHHLQMLLAEKEAQYVTATAALNEAKMEIARLKRL